MAFVPINISTPNDGLGDTPFVAGEKINDAIRLNTSSAFCTYGGTANAITLASINTQPQTAYVIGAQYRFRATAINTGASTINIDTLGAVALKTVTGAALPAGYIRTDVDTVVTYDGVDFIAGRDDEYGSNANGEFWRYASGAVITLQQIERVDGLYTNLLGGVRSGGMLFTFPAVFIDTPSVSAGSLLISALGVGLDLITATGGSCFFTAFSCQASATLKGSITSTGRWY